MYKLNITLRVQFETAKESEEKTTLNFGTA